MFHMKDTLHVTRKRAMLAKRHDVTFKPFSENMESEELTSAAAILHLMQIEHAMNIYRFIQGEALCSTDYDTF